MRMQHKVSSKNQYVTQGTENARPADHRDSDCGPPGRADGRTVTATVMQQKLARLATGGRPRVLDLFSGCGGLSLGFQAAGFQISAALEIDPDAAKSHGLNFHKDAPEHALARDITAVSPQEL